MEIVEENQNKYAYQLMCFMDILNGYDSKLWQHKLGFYYQDEVISSSEELFECLGRLISDANKKDKNSNIPRYEYWQNFIYNFIRIDNSEIK